MGSWWHYFLLSLALGPLYPKSDQTLLQCDDPTSSTTLHFYGPTFPSLCFSVPLNLLIYLSPFWAKNMSILYPKSVKASTCIWLHFNFTIVWRFFYNLVPTHLISIKSTNLHQISWTWVVLQDLRMLSCPLFLFFSVPFSWNGLPLFL